MFSPPLWIVISFACLTLIVLSVDLALLREASPRRGLAWPAAIVAGWLVLHALLTVSGVTSRVEPVPLMMPVALFNVGVGVWLAFGDVGERLKGLPLWLLAGAQAFRLPLEILLHELGATGNLPVEMTWSGLNFDVITGILGALILIAAQVTTVPRWCIWAFNVIGSVLLVTVVSIAVMTLPGPLRVFTEATPNVLPMRMPFNYIVTVHVLTALTLHLVTFRALLTEDRAT